MLRGSDHEPPVPPRTVPLPVVISNVLKLTDNGSASVPTSTVLLLETLEKNRFMDCCALAAKLTVEDRCKCVQDDDLSEV